MGQISKKLRNAEDSNGGKYLSFWCPGCKQIHQIKHAGPGAVWGWNGNIDVPTFTPSVLVWWDEPAARGNSELLKQQIEDKRAGRIDKIPYVDCRCHSFVTDGRIQFLGDCTHELAGQTVDLPDLPLEWCD